MEFATDRALWGGFRADRLQGGALSYPRTRFARVTGRLEGAARPAPMVAELSVTG